VTKSKGFLNDAPISDLMNLISMSQANLLRDVKIPNKQSRMDIPLTYELKEKYRLLVNNAPVNKDIIYISGGAFKDKLADIFPLDFKVSARSNRAKEAKLKTLSVPEGKLPPIQDIVMALAADLPRNTNDDANRDSAMTAAFERPTGEIPVVQFNSFMNMIDVSHNEGTYAYTYRKPLNPELSPDMSLSFINIEIPPSKEDKGYKKTWWTVLAPAGLTSYRLPELPGGLSQLPALKDKEELNWTVNLFKLGDAEIEFSDMSEKNLVSHVTHFSRNKITMAKAK